MMGDGFGMGGGFLGLFWITLLVLVVVWVFRAAGSRDRSTQKSALELLQERYARGEIDREEFIQKRKDLSG